jgi:hypothetical protein
MGIVDNGLIICVVAAIETIDPYISTCSDYVAVGSDPLRSNEKAGAEPDGLIGIVAGLNHHDSRLSFRNDLGDSIRSR